jgi:hypothetical protein
MMERGTPRDIQPNPRFLDIHAPTPKVAFFNRILQTVLVENQFDLAPSG